jgi:mRNA-degrading endonuclease toxin of MazEF toxin-antitoxin module
MLLAACHETSHQVNASFLDIVQHQTMLVSRLCQAHSFQIRNVDGDKMNLYVGRNSADLVADASDADPTRN